MHARWLQFLQRFDFVIKHTSGKTKAADALNQKGILLTILQSQVIAFYHIPTLYPYDTAFKSIWETCSNHNKPCKDYHIVNDFLFKGDVLCVPHTSLREAIIKEAHFSGLAGHFSREKTLAVICSKFFWPQLNRDVTNFIKRCFICQTC